MSPYHFWLEVCLVWSKYSSPAFFWFLLAWKILFHLFVLSLCLSLEVKWVSRRQHVVGSYVFIHLATPCLSLGKLIHLYLVWSLVCKHCLLPYYLLPMIISPVLLCPLFLFTFVNLWFSMVICLVFLFVLFFMFPIYVFACDFCEAYIHHLRWRCCPQKMTILSSLFYKDSILLFLPFHIFDITKCLLFILWIP